MNENMKWTGPTTLCGTILTRSSAAQRTGEIFLFFRAPGNHQNPDLSVSPICVHSIILQNSLPGPGSAGVKTEFRCESTEIAHPVWISLTREIFKQKLSNLPTSQHAPSLSPAEKKAAFSSASRLTLHKVPVPPRT